MLGQGPLEQENLVTVQTLPASASSKSAPKGLRVNMFDIRMGTVMPEQSGSLTMPHWATVAFPECWALLLQNLEN